MVQSEITGPQNIAQGVFRHFCGTNHNAEQRGIRSQMEVRTEQ
jgi:hypothetical protein